MATTTYRPPHTGNVVRDVTAHLQHLVRTGNTAPLTPAQAASACGYAGNKASSLRGQARKVGAGARQNGQGRYNSMAPAAMLAWLGAVVPVVPGKATKAQLAKAHSTSMRMLWPKAAKASKRGARQAKAKATAPTEPTAPAQAPTDTTAPAQATN